MLIGHHFVKNANVYLYVRNSLFICIVSRQFYPLHKLYIVGHFIFFPSALFFSQLVSFLKVFRLKICIPLFCIRITSPSHLILLYLFTLKGLESSKNVKVLYCTAFFIPRYFCCIKSIYSEYFAVFSHLQSMSFSQDGRPSFTPILNNS